VPPAAIKGPDKGFVLGPGPLGERHSAIAWPMALKALQNIQSENRN